MAQVALLRDEEDVGDAARPAGVRTRPQGLTLANALGPVSTAA